MYNEIIEVKQNWPSKYFRLDLSLGNICNFKCWYCFPGCNTGTISYPDFDLLVKNVSYLFDYYAEHAGKKKFIINLVGGEPTHWKRFIDFVKYFKEHYDCAFTMHTNASKKLDWWEQAAPHLDSVSISHHQEFANKEHNRAVADLLYEHKVIATVQVLMDPHRWDECIESIEYFKNSRHRWAIKMEEVRHPTINYTEEQKEVIGKLRMRRANPIFFLMNNNVLPSKPKVIDVNKKAHKIVDNTLVLNRMNKFKGWDCSLGVHWLDVRPDGTLGGTCRNMLFNDSATYNILDEDFTEKFQPAITSTICHTDECWCSFETNMPKKK
jgi:organic radical activating enzyme